MRNNTYIYRRPNKTFLLSLLYVFRDEPFFFFYDFNDMCIYGRCDGISVIVFFFFFVNSFPFFFYYYFIFGRYKSVAVRASFAVCSFRIKSADPLWTRHKSDANWVNPFCNEIFLRGRARERVTQHRLNELIIRDLSSALRNILTHSNKSMVCAGDYCCGKFLGIIIIIFFFFFLFAILRAIYVSTSRAGRHRTAGAGTTGAIAPKEKLSRG